MGTVVVNVTEDARILGQDLVASVIETLVELTAHEGLSYVVVVAFCGGVVAAGVAGCAFGEGGGGVAAWGSAVDDDCAVCVELAVGFDEATWSASAEGKCCGVGFYDHGGCHNGEGGEG